jgi:hypothetical protein
MIAIGFHHYADRQGPEYFLMPLSFVSTAAKASAPATNRIGGVAGPPSVTIAVARCCGLPGWWPLDC